jgi:hypothetical protein
VPDTTDLVLTAEIQVNYITVAIKLEWPNYDYYFLYPVGRPTFNVSCDLQTQCSLSGARAPDYEIWPVWFVFCLQRAHCLLTRNRFRQICSLGFCKRQFLRRLCLFTCCRNPHTLRNRSPAAIVGSNPTGAWMFVCCVCCQVAVSATS